MLKQKKLHQTHTKVCVWSISTQGRHKGFPTTLIQSISIKLKPLISLKSSFKHEIVITSLKGSQVGQRIRTVKRTRRRRYAFEGCALKVKMGSFRMVIKHVIKNRTRIFEASAST
uniref:Uncharacterized protein n=1 Tax=Helianthus annuus TaxID=4232 RepID=A0A251SZ39_HELAN